MIIISSSVLLDRQIVRDLVQRSDERGSPGAGIAAEVYGTVYINSNTPLFDVFV